MSTRLAYTCGGVILAMCALYIGFLVAVRGPYWPAVLIPPVFCAGVTSYRMFQMWRARQ